MAAQVLNIAGTTPIEDPEYRYKMPKLIGKVEGRGNGIKTAIPNMTSIATSLHRPPGEVTKFFGCELGAQTTWTDDTERAIVNGAHTTQVLQEKLSIYIEKFVLCPACRLPETSYKIKSECIYHQCVACGAREPVDMQHKLTTYILKSYKLEKKEKKADEKKKDKKKDNGDDDKKKKKKKKKDLTEEEKAEKKRKKAEKKAAKDAGVEKENVDEDDDDDDDDDDERTVEKKQKKKTHKKKSSDDEEDDDDDDDGDDDAVMDDASAMESAIAGLKTKLQDNPTAAEIVGEARAVQTFCALPRNERAYMLLAATYPDPTILLAAPNDRDAKILAALRDDVGPASLIGGLEKLAMLANLVPKFPIILKHLYDEDILEESHVLDWHATGLDADHDTNIPADLDESHRTALLKASQPFVVWLQQADEEDDDDDDDDDDD